MVSHPIIEVNYETLESVATQFGERAEQLEAMLKHLDQQANELEAGWKGQGADAFFLEYEEDLRPSIQRSIDSLYSAARATTTLIQLYSEAEENAANVFMNGGAASAGKNAGHNVAEKAGAQQKDASKGTTDINGNALVDGQAYIIKDGQLIPYTGGDVDVVHINGIRTDAGGFKDGLTKIADKHDGKVVVGIYNKSDGGAEDIIQALGDRFEGETGWHNKNAATEGLLKLMQEDMKDGRLDMQIEAYSQGGAITASALNRLRADGISAEQMSHMQVTTYGSFGTDYPPGPDYRHIVHMGDLVPGFANATNLILTSPRAAFDYYMNLEVYPPKFNWNPIDMFHGLDGYLETAAKYPPISVRRIGEGVIDVMGDGIEQVWDLFN